MPTVLIGLDDTDNDTSPGTGQLARRLMTELVQRGAKPLGITRHQFLVDDRIPYTSHNSGACVAIEWSAPIEDLTFCMDLLAAWSADGSDPGMCIADLVTVPRQIMDWGCAATREVLTIDKAIETARLNRMNLRMLGGTGQGIIGALGSVGLRADGNEGRFLDLPGLREVGDLVSAADLARLGIEIEHEGRGPGDNRIARYRTQGWLRPRLIKGKAVWPVEWSNDDDAWISIDRKRSRPLE
jgi:hypothetical protein